MKHIENFECEICHAQYNTREQAINCEKSHSSPIGIVKGEYKPKGDVPYELFISFDNGCVYEYKLVSMDTLKSIRNIVGKPIF